MATLNLHVPFPLFGDGDFVLLRYCCRNLLIYIFSAARVDSVSFISFGVPFIVENMTKMAPTIGARSLCPANSASQ